MIEPALGASAKYSSQPEESTTLMFFVPTSVTDGPHRARGRFRGRVGVVESGSARGWNVLPSGPIGVIPVKCGPSRQGARIRAAGLGVGLGRT